MSLPRRLAWLAGAFLIGHAAAQESMTLTKIRETGVIVLGYRDASIPFSYLDEQRKPIGYSLDLCYHIAEAAKATLKLRHLDIKLVPVTSATRIPFLVNEVIDLECGSTTNALERQQMVSFTHTIFVSACRMVSKKSSRIRTALDLRGRTVVSTAGTTSIKVLSDLNTSRGLEMSIVSRADHFESFQMVTTDRAAAFAMDDVILHGLVASTRDPDGYTISTEALSTEPYGIVLRANDREFKKIADGALVQLFRSGEIERIYNKWFQSPIPPGGINLRLPMSPALKRVFANPTDSADPSRYQ